MKRVLLIAIIPMLSALLTVSSAGAGPTTVRTAPFDFGCRNYMPGRCDHFEPAKQGVLHAVMGYGPAVVYGPPFVWVGAVYSSTYTGIDLGLRAQRRVHATGKVRVDGGGVQSPTQLCLMVIDGRYRLKGTRCRPLAVGSDTAEIALSTRLLPAGRYRLLLGPEWKGISATTVRVDSIAYRLG